MAKLFAKSGDPDQTPHSAASDLGLHCLPITFLLVSRLQWDKAELVTVILEKTDVSPPNFRFFFCCALEN